MKEKHKKQPVLFILLFSGLVLLIILLMQPAEVIHLAEHIPFLFPNGIIGLQERDLLFFSQIIMLLVVIPVYFLTFVFSWKYRAHNPKAKYTPDWDDDRVAEYIWWGIPCMLTLLVGVVTLTWTYQLDPFKPLESEKKPVKIQVVALQWKWLFIYPEEQIATVNFFQFPEKTPLNFEITADAPMNSFWIPRLGGQIYAMPRMRTKLHLIADATGEFQGSSANISGLGFAGMRFIAKSSSEEDFQKWLKAAKQSPGTLSLEEYTQLAKPSENNPVATYRLKEENLFDQIIMKYMHPQMNE